MSPAHDVVVGGYPGKRLTMRPQRNACADDGPWTMWVDPNGDDGRGLEPESRDRPDKLWILDVDGERLVIVATPFDKAAAGIVDDVIATMEFAID